MKHEECPGTLLARSRQHGLSPAEFAALDAHLRICECCRLSQQVMLDFDEDTISERHDGARILRLAAFARQQVVEQRAPHSVNPHSVGPHSVGPRSVSPQVPLHRAAPDSVVPIVARERSIPPPVLERVSERVPAFGFWAGLRARLPKAGSSAGQRHAGTLLTAAAIFLVVAGASGAILVQRVVRDQEAAAQRAVFRDEVGAPVAHRARQIAKVAVPHVDEQKIASVLREYESPMGDDASASLRTRCPGAGCTSSDASAMFKQANQARREGRSAAAIGLYQQLQRLHLSSPEAQLSHLSLGHLLLASGKPSQALNQFNSALGSSGASSVKAEALYGKGLALGRLGRSSEERSTWQRLLSEFGSSPYAAHARRRLSPAP